MQSNLPMVESVASLLGPRGRSLIRSAGRLGVLVYKKEFATTRQGVWVELQSCPLLNDGDEDVPLHAPLSGTTFSKVNRSDAMVVFDVDVDRSLMTAKRFVTPIKQICNRKDVQHAVIRLPVKEPHRLTTLRGYFMMETRRLRTLTLHGLENITYVCPYFLLNCKDLEQIDLSAMEGIRAIGPHFMKGCSGLKSIQFGKYNRLAEIYEDFMTGCSSVKSLEFNGFTQVHRIHHRFLVNCSALESVTFTGWGGVHNLPCYFMSGCTSLKKLDTSAIGPGVPSATIGSYFLSGCTNLTHLILPKLASANYNFLRGCDSLQVKDIDFGGTPESVLLPHINVVRTHNIPSSGSPADALLSPTASVCALLPPAHQALIRSAGSHGHTAFQDVVTAKMLRTYVQVVSSAGDVHDTTTSSHLSAYHAPIDTTFNPRPELPSNVTVVMSNTTFHELSFQPFSFFDRVKLMGVEKVTSIGITYGMATGIQDIEIEGPMDNLVDIHQYAFYHIPTLRSIHLPPLPNLSTISYYFMAECTSLTSLELSGLVNLFRIDNCFLMGCTSLVSVDLGSLPSLSIVGPSFLEECPRLNSLTMTDMMKLEDVSPLFLRDLPALSHRHVAGNGRVTDSCTSSIEPVY